MSGHAAPDPDLIRAVVAVGGLENDVAGRNPQVGLDVVLDVAEPVGAVVVGDRVALRVERADHDLVAVAVPDRDHPEVDVTEHALGLVDGPDPVAAQVEVGQVRRSDVLLGRADVERGRRGAAPGPGPRARWRRRRARDNSGVGRGARFRSSVSGSGGTNAGRGGNFLPLRADRGSSHQQEHAEKQLDDRERAQNSGGGSPGFKAKNPLSKPRTEELSDVARRVPMWAAEPRPA